ncbi:MAG: OmpA family protein [Burkholderiales bacterium]|nr:OmpA family protein [Phycisphaerae bacterium]
MKRISALAAVASVAMITGCIPIEKYNALKLEARGYEEGLKDAQRAASEQQARADALQGRLSAMDASGGDFMAAINSKDKQLALKQSELDELNKRYADAIANAGKSGALPVPLTNELKAFAAQNPDLIEFDEGRGIVKFKSDVTFDLGDATLKPKAKEVIQKFATILNSPAASGYELLVAGHTDSAPVSNPATIQKGHRNNWYLSAHRAISVAEELIGEKTSAQRIGAVGYADQRPTASNGSDKGREANRRVEVLILPTQVRSTAPAAGTGTAPKPRTDNKDGGTAPAPTPAAPASTDNK